MAGRRKGGSQKKTWKDIKKEYAPVDKATSAGAENYGYETYGGGENFYGQERPELISGLTKGGDLDSRLTETLSPEMQAMKSTAMSYDEETGQYGINPDDSPWAAKQKDLISGRVDEARAQTDATSKGAADTQQMMSAMRGGVSDDSNERAQRSRDLQKMGVKAGIASQAGELNRGVETQDYMTKLRNSGTLGEAEQMMGMRNADMTQSRIDEMNKTAAGIYSTDMKGYGQKMTADLMKAYANQPDKSFGEEYFGGIMPEKGILGTGLYSDNWLTSVANQFDPSTYSSVGSTVDNLASVASVGLVGDGGVVSSPSKWIKKPW